MASKIIKQEKLKKEHRIRDLIKQHSFVIMQATGSLDSHINTWDKVWVNNELVINNLIKEINQ